MDRDAVDKVSEELESQNLGDTAIEEAKPENKLTQTDHVNKKLLDSFLERLNHNDNSVAFAFTASSNASQADIADPESHSGDEKENDDKVSSMNDTAVEEAKPENKPTQTDHVNKKLLDSFLERLNQNDNSVAFAFTVSSNASQADLADPEFHSGDEKESDDKVSSMKS